MKKIVFGLLVVCSVNVYADQANPCWVEKTVTKTKEDGQLKVSEETKTVCSDQHGHIFKDLGVAKNCGESTEWVVLPNGKEMAVRNLVCQKFDGRWELIPEYSARR